MLTRFKMYGTVFTRSSILNRKGGENMAYDFSKLVGKITEVFSTQAKFADAMGLSERTVSLKLNGKVEWKQSEIFKTCELLGVPLSQIPAYFFSAEVQY